MKTEGYELSIHIITNKLCYNNYKTEYFVKHHVMKGIFRVPKIGSLLFRFIGPFLALKKELSKNEAIFISNMFNLPSLLIAKVFYNRVTYYDQREMFLFGIGSNLSPFRKSLNKNWERLFLRYVDYLFTVDSHKNIWANRYRNIARNVYVIKNVPSIIDIDPQVIKGNIKSRNLDDIIYLTIVGGIQYNQGVENLLEAVRLIPDKSFYLYLIGEINIDFIKKIDNIITNSLSNCRLFTKKFMPYKDLVIYISKFHLGFHLKDPDVGQYGWIGPGNSRKPFTYMQAGLPVIAPNRRSVALQIEEENCGFRVDVKKPYEIANAIRQLIEDHNKYFNFSFNGVDAIVRKYNWENEAQNLKKLFST
jgi:glycosyltransferase involved in cell wall biosynthesis